MKTSHLSQLCRQLQLSSIAATIDQACEQSTRQKQAPQEFLSALFQQESDYRNERRAYRRIKEGKFPVIKTLESFDFQRAHHLPEVQLRELAEGHYIRQAESIILMGEPGTGKTHLACALGYAAAQQGHAVRFMMASQLVNLLVEAKDSRVLSTITQRFAQYKLLILDELGYLPLTKADSELLFQVISQRQERLPLIITTNLPFSEWTSIFPDPRLCKALIDRITHRAHIIETGQQSVRLEQTLQQRRDRKK